MPSRSCKRSVSIRWSRRRFKIYRKTTVPFSIPAMVRWLRFSARRKMRWPLHFWYAMAFPATISPIPASLSSCGPASISAPYAWCAISTTRLTSSATAWMPDSRSWALPLPTASWFHAPTTTSLLPEIRIFLACFPISASRPTRTYASMKCISWAVRSVKRKSPGVKYSKRCRWACFRRPGCASRRWACFSWLL